jgi:succinate dehydrogenase hydrophobic anchor subunit
MRRPPSRYLPHSYALMAVSAALTVFVVVQLVQYAQASYTAWPVFAAGLITAAYVGLVVGILLYVPRERL